MDTAEDAPQAEPSAQAAPGIEEALRALGSEGRAGLDAAGDVAKALRILVAADISLARSAMGRTLAFTSVAIAFGASSWLLLMTAMILGMQRVGLSLLWALLMASILSATITVVTGAIAVRYFQYTRMKATRRQLARLGLGELADFLPGAGSAQPAAAAAEQVSEAAAEAPIKKGLGVDVTPP